MPNFTRYFKSAALLLALLSGLISSPVARADATDTCFTYLGAQDYARAEAEAKTLLSRTHAELSRTEQRYAYLCLGRAYQEQGRTRDALPAFQQVESLAQTTEELAIAYNQLGLIFANLNDLDRAELYHQRALKANKETGNKNGESVALSNLAGVVQDRGDVDRALALYQEALALEPDEAKKSFKLNNIATIYAGRQEYAKAVKMLRQAIEIDRRNGNAHHTAIVQINLGSTLRLQGKFKSAEQELASGLNTIRLVGDKYWEAEACQSLGRLSAAQKKFSLAREWFEKAEVLYRDVGNTAKSDEMAAHAAALGK